MHYVADIVANSGHVTQTFLSVVKQTAQLLWQGVYHILQSIQTNKTDINFINANILLIRLG